MPASSTLKKMILVLCLLINQICCRPNLNWWLRNIKEVGLCTIYKNGLIYTVDPWDIDWDKNPQTAMVVDDVEGKIKYLGSDEKAELEYGGFCKTLDLEGGVVYPGFHDVHVHPLEAMNENGGCIFRKDTPPEALLKDIKECVAAYTGTGKEWVLAHGHSIEQILHHVFEGGRPPRKIIDEACPDIPFVIMEETSHSVWVNSKALEVAGYNKNSQNPIGGIIMKDRDTNEPNGILFENAGNMMMVLAMKSFSNAEEANFRALKEGLKEMASNGITSVCDARLYWQRNNHYAWQRACDEGLLTVRAVLGLWAYPNMDDDEQFEHLEYLYNDNYNKLKCSLRMNEIKLYSDGLLETTTAKMLKPYYKNLSLPGLNDNKGMNYFTGARIKKYLERLQSFGNGEGFDFHIHAIGDSGIREVLDAIEESYVPGTRHRMTHLHIINKEDVPRFHELDVVADFQVENVYLPGVVEVVGLDRARDYIPVLSVQNTSATVTLSSDWDVNPLYPLGAIAAAANRGHQSVTVKSAIEMRTVNSAYAMRQEQVTGHLAVGMAADFVVLDDDVLHSSSIGTINILVTVLDGKVVFQEYKDYPKVVKH